MFREFSFIERLAERFGREGRGLEVGIGSDCAVLRNVDLPPIVTIDTMVEGVHFDLRYMSWEDVGYRTISTCLSDLAASAADPKSPIVVFLSLTVPDSTDEAALDPLLDGFSIAFEEYGATLGGGDTVSTTGPMVLTAAAIGYAQHPLARHGAKPQDLIAVVGTLGGAGAALRLLREGAAGEHDGELLAAYRRPKALLEMGIRLAMGGATASADVSDGLLADAGRIAERSGVAMTIDLEKLPLHPGLANNERFGGERERAITAATSGDDYTLVLTCPAENFDDIREAARLLHLPIASVGHCDTGPAGRVTVFYRGEPIPVTRRGFEHGA